jgi:hypothetical protein
MVDVNYELISAADYENLPIDPDACFVALDDICQSNMNRMIDQDTSSDFDTSIRMQYMTTMAAYAKECGIDEIVSAYTEPYDFQAFASFSLAVKGAVARIRFRNRTANRTSSVLLLQNTKTKIEHYISRLKEAIEQSDLPIHRREALCQKLEELRAELNQPRLSFVKTFTVLSLILAGLGSATTVSADGPTAVTHIMRLIGLDRQTEEEAAHRLAPPPKALPAPVHPHTTKPLPPHLAARRPIQPISPKGGDLDDEIPF